MIKKIKRKDLLHIVNKLHELFATFSNGSSEDLRLAIKIVGAIDKWVTCEGHQGLKRAKTMSNVFVRHLMGTPIPLPSSNRYRRLVLKALERCDSTPRKIYWVSIFSSFRLFKLEPEVDVSTITGRFEGRLIGLFRLNYLSKLRTTKQSFRNSIPELQNWNATWKWHISGAAGPNGPLAYTQYLKDLRSLGYSWLSVGLLTLFLTLPYDNKGEAVKALRDALYDSYRMCDKKVSHSKLVFLSDKGGKTRVIAIGDILSQSLLKTVHQRCNLVLRRLSQDGTFDQDRSRMYIRKMSRDMIPLASVDLTAATDRMPALFQVFVIVYLRILSPLQALGWWLVTTKRSFALPRTTKCVRYKVGQPMGLLSSWPVMAISHHFLIRWSYAVNGHNKPEKSSYCLLGDDLSFNNSKNVSAVYLDLIDCLGMKYSVDKTYISVGVAEFAKSLYCHGEDLTPFPLALLKWDKNTLVSNTLAIIAECKRINLPLTAARLQGIFPKRWRNLVLLAALSPSSPRYGLDLHSRSDQWIFQQFVLSKKIMYFSRLNTVRDSTHAFAINDPGTSGKRLASPFLQIGQDNSISYPVRQLKDNKRLLNPELLLGSNWISYDTVCWPNGIPTIGDQNLVPGPTWKKERDNVIFRSSLLELNKLLPEYFTVRCVGKQVGE